MAIIAKSCFKKMVSPTLGNKIEMNKRCRKHVVSSSSNYCLDFDISLWQDFPSATEI